MKFSICYTFIKYQLKTQHINLKFQCYRHGMNYNTITKILSEERKDIRLGVLLFLAKIINCTLADIIRLEEK